MPEFSIDERRSKILQMFSQIRPMIEFLGGHLIPNGVHLDVGSYDGIMALEVAKALGVKSSILTDIENNLEVTLPANVRFEIADVCSQNFTEKYYCKMAVLSCLSAFHEFSEPFAAVTNMISVLPVTGKAFIFDYNEDGWKKSAELACGQGDASVRHFAEDMLKLKKSGLASNEGIRYFWEEIVSPRVPGRCIFNMTGDFYCVLYEAANWGVFKSFPYHLV